MRKNSKKQLVSNGSNITNYFKPNLPPSTQLSASATAQATTQHVPSNPSLSTDVPTRTQTPRVVSRKRSRSPGHLSAEVQPVSPGAEPLPKSSCLNESLPQRGNGVTPSTPNPQKRKKPRLEQLRAEIERIPSSQSDEEELQSRTPRISPAESSGTESRKSILPLTPDHDDEDLAMDLDESTNPTPQIKPFHTPPKNPSQEQMLTPPLSDLIPSSSPPSPAPVVMDAAQRTADLIARLRKEAESKVERSPEPESPTGFSSFDFDSSDDEEPDPFLFISKAEASTSSAAAGPSTSTGSTEEQNLRRSTRTRAPKAQKDASPALAKPKAQKRPSNPFAALSKDKRGAEKQGKALQTISRADEIVKGLGKTSLFDEMDNEEDDGSFPTLRIGKVGAKQDWLRSKAFTSADSKNLGDDDRELIFGEDGGKALLKILDKDQDAARLVDEAVGIIFWTAEDKETDASMPLDQCWKGISIPGNHPCIGPINAALQNGDAKQLWFILQADIVSFLPPLERLPLIQQLCELAFLPNANGLDNVATRSLSHHWSISDKSDDSGLRFAPVAAALRRFGASETIMQSLGWSVDHVKPLAGVTTQDREDLMQKVAKLSGICARSGRLDKNDIPDLIMALLLMGSDVTISAHSRRLVITALDEICNCEALHSESLKSKICDKVLSYIRGCSQAEQAHILALLHGGGNQTQSFASFVAYCLLTGTATVPYQSIPPLEPIIEILSKTSGQGHLLSITDKTDYTSLGAVMQTIFMVMSNLHPYLTPAYAVPRKEVLADLDAAHSNLDLLHDRIVDTRGVHLDRTRLKAKIKAISMHIYYVALGARRSTASKSNPTLSKFFKPKPALEDPF